MGALHCQEVKYPGRPPRDHAVCLLHVSSIHANLHLPYKASIRMLFNQELHCHYQSSSAERLIMATENMDEELAYVIDLSCSRARQLRSLKIPIDTLQERSKEPTRLSESQQQSSPSMAKSPTSPSSRPSRPSRMDPRSWPSPPFVGSMEAPGTLCVA